MGTEIFAGCPKYPRHIVLQFNSSEADMLQFVNLLFQPVIKLLHHHQAFIGSDATLSSHAESQKHTFYSEMLHTDL